MTSLTSSYPRRVQPVGYSVNHFYFHGLDGWKEEHDREVETIDGTKGKRREDFYIVVISLRINGAVTFFHVIKLETDLNAQFETERWDNDDE